ncbi:MAG: hypothetical protein V1826_02030 [bacterium]
MADKPVGKVTHYYDKLGVAIIELGGGLKVGDTITFKKGGVDLATQPVDSMQIERAPVSSAKKGEIIGLKVDQPIREGVEVYTA